MTPSDVPWRPDQHTLAKERLYRKYVGKWMPIMVRGYGGDVTYAEGFAGPGIYADGSPGSPVIALRCLLEQRGLEAIAKQKPVRLLFVDKDSRCTKLLQERLAVAANGVQPAELARHGIDVEIVTGTCEPDLTETLTRHHAWGRPMLVVLDTWGSAVPLDLVRRVARNGHSEVLITIKPQFFSRFAEAKNVQHGDAVFGGDLWRQVAAQPAAQKARWLLQHYRDVIRDAGFEHVLDFELMTDRGEALYLVFGTTHTRGLEKMKEAMWEVDEVAGIGYRDPRDPDQQTLEIEVEPQTAPLRRLLRNYLLLQEARRVRVEELRAFAFLNTVYKKSQVLPVLRAMHEAGELAADQTRVGFSSSVWIS